MIALYIILGIVLLFALILNLPVGLSFKFNNAIGKLAFLIGFVKIPLLPEKKKKLKLKKIYSQIKDIKLSEYQPKKIGRRKKKKSTLDELREMVRDRENVGFLFEKLIELLREYSDKYGKRFHITVRELKLSLELGSPDKTCIALGAIYPALSGLITYLDTYSSLKVVNPDSISFAPSFTEGMTRYAIDVKIRVRLIVFLVPAVKTIISILIKTNQQKKGINQND